MPIKDKDFGKYKRPDIFIEEIDNSVIELPIQDVLVNLVPGFSKKGPINAPVYVTNPTSFAAIFGDDDRRLENKGSFFHKTVKQMLKSGPVWALNLLATNPNRDKVEWQSISVSAQYENGSVTSSAYQSFFNRQDFWERDTDAFLNVVKANNYGIQDADRLFHITNMGDKDITVFMYKSRITGFDVTAEEWYGDRTKVPAYIDYRELISDYLVAVVVVAGDWSDYTTLSNDTTFGKYFNKNGLMKTQVNNFLNERTVTILAKYDCSLIPYFKDMNNRDMYIKNVINNNTDQTGLFCTYNENSLLEADFKLGNLDIIGDVLAGQDVSSIKFMSYDTTLKDTQTYTLKYLDSSNNSMTNVVDSMINGISYRSGVYTNGHTFDIYCNTGSTSTSSAGYTIPFVWNGIDAYYVINGTIISGGTSTSVTGSSISSSYTVGSRYDVLYLTSDNTINILYGNAVNTINAIPPDYNYSLDSTIILGYVKYTKSGTTYTLDYIGVTVDAVGYIPIGGKLGYGTTVTNSTDTTGDYLNIIFEGTSGKSGVYNDYNYLRTLQAFNELHDNVGTKSVVIQNGVVSSVSVISLVNSAITYTGGTGYTIGNVLTLVGGDGLCTVSVNSISNVDSGVTSVSLVNAGIYTPGNYTTTGGTGIGCIIKVMTNAGTGYAVGQTLTLVGGDGLCTVIIDTTGTTSGVSVVSLVNTASFDYTPGNYSTTGGTGSGCIVTVTIGTDLTERIKVPVTSVSSVHASTSINAHIKMYMENPKHCHYNNTFLLYYIDNEFLLQESPKNTTNLQTVYNSLNFYTNKGIVGMYSQFYQDYYNGIINNLDYFYTGNNTGSTTKIYFKAFLDQDNILTVNFVLNEYDDPYTLENWPNDWLDSNGVGSIVIHSDKTNWKQSIEIESWIGDDLITCQEIKVNKDRYSEITRGSYLAAYYDEANWQAPDGPGYLEGSVPRKLTRVTNVKNDPNDDTLKTLYTDAPIKIVDFNISGGTLSGQSSSTVDYQTFTYPTIDAYVDEYKALKISPFVVHTDSIPNGTDARQNAILDVINKDTNLAKALADKNKISWRYLVDSFGLGLTPMTGYGSKQQLADLCGMKLNSVGFINMPSAKIFKESSNPSFVDADGNLNLEYVKNGADESKNPDYLYQFATQHGEIDGRSCVGYFFPYIRIYDNGIPKFVPPSSYAATTYMQKFVSNVAGMVPWTICAGITNGRVQGITKTEMDFTNTDLEYLHSMGANPIVYRVNNGYCINDESTAQIFPYSSLSFLHSREVLLELENRLYDMLLRYQWRFNTAEIRSEIKYKADKICKDMLDNDAFYDFWNVCDETNNTDYVIDLQMGVLDTYVEIIKGMGIIVNNITIMKKGDIQSMGFK